MTNEVEKRLTQFKEDLSHLSLIEIVRKHIISGECCKLSPNQYFDLRSEVADHFELCPNEVLVVGSAKLGFSVAPDKKYCLFHDKSDIDVAIVSSTLFDKFWKEIFIYWCEGSYWPGYKKFTDYFFRGWIRPDKLPPSRVFALRKDWWDFFQSITSSGEYGHYNIRGALYRSYFFLEGYQEYCVKQCMNVNI
jgi:hypothetical protein